MIQVESTDIHQTVEFDAPAPRPPRPPDEVDRSTDVGEDGLPATSVFVTITGTSREDVRFVISPGSWMCDPAERREISGGVPPGHVVHIVARGGDGGKGRDGTGSAEGSGPRNGSNGGAGGKGGELSIRSDNPAFFWLVTADLAGGKGGSGGDGAKIIPAAAGAGGKKKGGRRRRKKEMLRGREGREGYAGQITYWLLPSVSAAPQEAGQVILHSTSAQKLSSVFASHSVQARWMFVPDPEDPEEEEEEETIKYDDEMTGLLCLFVAFANRGPVPSATTRFCLYDQNSISSGAATPPETRSPAFEIPPLLPDEVQTFALGVKMRLCVEGEENVWFKGKMSNTPWDDLETVWKTWRDVAVSVYLNMRLVEEEGEEEKEAEEEGEGEGGEKEILRAGSVIRVHDVNYRLLDLVIQNVMLSPLDDGTGPTRTVLVTLANHTPETPPWNLQLRDEDSGIESAVFEIPHPVVQLGRKKDLVLGVRGEKTEGGRVVRRVSFTIFSREGFVVTKSQVFDLGIQLVAEKEEEEEEEGK